MRQPRVLLASRYEIVAPVPGDHSSSCFYGIDTTVGRSVVIRLAVPPQSRWLAASRGATHRHLASVVDVIDSPDTQAFPLTPTMKAATQAIVAEALRGESLAQHIQRERLGLDCAVAWVLRVAEAIRCLHSRGAAHGAISPYSILADARGRAIPPVVTQLLAEQLGAFASPERLTGEGPSPSDDLWAIGVLLHVLVTGALPHQGDSPGALLKAIHQVQKNHFSRLSGPYLRELEVITTRLLAPRRILRPTSIDDVIDTLDRWERRSPMSIQPAASTGIDRRATNQVAKLAEWDELLFSESRLPLDIGDSLAVIEDARVSTRPNSVAESAGLPPITASGDVQSSWGTSFVTGAAPAEFSQQFVSTTGAPRPPMPSESFSLRLRHRPRWGVLAILVALVGAVIGAAVVSLLGTTSGPGRNRVTAAAQRSPTPSEPSSLAHEHVSPRKELNACVRSYYPADAFATDPDLEFVCKSENLVEVVQRLNGLAVLVSADSIDGGMLDAGSIAASQHSARPVSSGALVVTAGSATRAWQLGWYELLATGIIQRNCCHEPPAIKLPATTGWCQQLQVVVTNIANQSTRSGDISSTVHAFDEAITCLMSQGRHMVYSYRTVPSAAQNAAFQQFLTHAAETDARRASKRLQ